MATRRPGPVVIEMDAAVPPDPGAAPMPQDLTVMADLSAGAQRSVVPGGRLARAGGWLLATFSGLVLYLAGLAAWDRTLSLLSERPVLGWIALALLAALALAVVAFAVRELAGLLRLGRIDTLRARAAAALAAEDGAAARRVADEIVALYRQRPDLAWATARYREGRDAAFDAHAALALAERTCIALLDEAAAREIEAAARNVAAVTALVPLALADVAAALLANLRMIRRIAAIYGGRSGSLGTWRLLRQVGVHLVATGAVAVGDDLIQSLAGGGLLAKLSRRFGEGVINGALTTRVGLAAVEVCRPLPYLDIERPKVTGLLTRGLRGLFPAGSKSDAAGP